ncbi:putative mannosylphosphate transferase (Mnn4) [Aspergillus stella-maris]|uniref:putative mannosylphosphate transferase (Mnn4) n=1 Tax=Aspergillus stella-maris TaxID=1810926 RepID=UPI003CCD046A
MNPRGILSLIGTLCAATATASAIPASNSHGAPATSPDHGTIVGQDAPLDLWSKYGLNTSDEYKYYQEPGNDEIHAHYDSRFFKNPVPKEQRSQVLTHIIHSYFEFFNDHKLETWLAHGTLLGWWWNGRIMPWDWDIDTQVSETTLFRLADEFNGTEYHYNTTNPDVEHSYLLDINPWARQRDRGMGLNIIDARWIDMKTGLYIDITGLSRLNELKPNEFGCKNNHNYLVNDIYPLRSTFFEGVAAKVPFRFESVLKDEYHEKALKETKYNHYTWDPALEEWISDEVIAAQKAKEKEEQEGKDDRQYE